MTISNPNLSQSPQQLATQKLDELKGLYAKFESIHNNDGAGVSSFENSFNANYSNKKLNKRPVEKLERYASDKHNLAGKIKKAFRGKEKQMEHTQKVADKAEEEVKQNIQKKLSEAYSKSSTKIESLMENIEENLNISNNKRLLRNIDFDSLQNSSNEIVSELSKIEKYKNFAQENQFPFDGKNLTLNTLDSLLEILNSTTSNSLSPQTKSNLSEIENGIYSNLLKSTSDPTIIQGLFKQSSEGCKNSSEILKKAEQKITKLCGLLEYQKNIEDAEVIKESINLIRDSCCENLQELSSQNDVRTILYNIDQLIEIERTINDTFDDAVDTFDEISQKFDSMYDYQLQILQKKTESDTKTILQEGPILNGHNDNLGKHINKLESRIGELRELQKVVNKKFDPSYEPLNEIIGNLRDQIESLLVKKELLSGKRILQRSISEFQKIITGLRSSNATEYFSAVNNLEASPARRLRSSINSYENDIREYQEHFKCQNNQIDPIIQEAKTLLSEIQQAEENMKSVQSIQFTSLLINAEKTQAQINNITTVQEFSNNSSDIGQSINTLRQTLKDYEGSKDFNPDFYDFLLQEVNGVENLFETKKQEIETKRQEIETRKIQKLIEDSRRSIFPVVDERIGRLTEYVNDTKQWFQNDETKKKSILGNLKAIFVQSPSDEDKIKKFFNEIPASINGICQALGIPTQEENPTNRGQPEPSAIVKSIKNEIDAINKNSSKKLSFTETVKKCSEATKDILVNHLVEQSK